MPCGCFPCYLSFSNATWCSGYGTLWVHHFSSTTPPYRYHFGNERFSEAQMLLAGRWRRLSAAGDAGDFEAARTLLGLSLAAIQDFYSHTNWVELGNKKFNPDVGKACLYGLF